MPGLASGMVPKMEACLRAVRGGVPPGARARWAGRARDAARDLHRLRRRDHGDPMSVTAERDQLLWPPRRRLHDDLRPPAARTGARRGQHGLRRRRRELPRPDRRHRGVPARPRASEGHRGRHRAAVHARPHQQPLRHRARGRPCRETAGAARPVRAPADASSSATPAPRPTRRPSRSPAGPDGRRSSPPRAASTAARWGRCRSPASRPSARRSSRCCRACGSCPTATRRALRGAVSSATAAVFLEPTLGEGGVVPPPAGYLQAAREACDAAGALLVIDEVQSVGRTGTWYAHQQAGNRPRRHHPRQGAGRRAADRCLHRAGPAAGLLQPGDHGSTFGGNPVVCAAALAVIDVIESEGLIAQAAAGGRQLSAGPSGVRRTAARRGAGDRAVARDDARRTASRRPPSAAFRAPASWSTPSRPTRCASRRHSCSPQPKPTGSLLPCRESWRCTTQVAP